MNMISMKSVVWLVIGIVIGGLVFAKNVSLLSILPFGLILLCPIMMVAMMSGHKHHHDHSDAKKNEEVP